MSEDKLIWTIKDVMRHTGLNRKQATMLLNRKGCPLVGKHVYNHKYYVRREAFLQWLQTSAAYF